MSGSTVKQLAFSEEQLHEWAEQTPNNATGAHGHRRDLARALIAAREALKPFATCFRDGIRTLPPGDMLLVVDAADEPLADLQARDFHTAREVAGV